MHQSPDGDRPSRAPPAADATDRKPTRYASDTKARKPHLQGPRTHTRDGTFKLRVSKMFPSQGSEAALLNAEQGRRASRRQTARDQQMYKGAATGPRGHGEWRGTAEGGLKPGECPGSRTPLHSTTSSPPSAERSRSPGAPWCSVCVQGRGFAVGSPCVCFQGPSSHRGALGARAQLLYRHGP